MNEETIICKCCLVSKNSDEFYFRKDTAKKQRECKECYRKRVFIYKEKHRTELAQTEKIRYIKNHEEILKKVNTYRMENAAKVKIQKSLSYHRNKEAHSLRMKKYRQEHVVQIREHSRIVAIGKYRSNIPYRINNRMSCSIRLSIYSGKNGKSWESLVGYSLEQLMNHLEKQFKQGMTWDNYGRNGWHIDHVIPISAFNFQTFKDVDFKRCWALDNLRPLWELDNIRKSNKVDKPFQPYLSMEI